MGKTKQNECFTGFLFVFNFLTELCRGQIGRYKLQKKQLFVPNSFSPTLFFGGGISYDHDDDVCNDDDDDSDAYDDDADNDDDDDDDVVIGGIGKGLCSHPLCRGNEVGGSIHLSDAFTSGL